MRPIEVRRPTSRTLRRALSVAAAALALGGIGLISYPFATDLWAARIQAGLAGEFAAAGPEFRLQSVGVGDPLTRLEIPKLGVDVMVVEGVTLTALRAGAGHYPQTPLPGEKGNVAIAGHRTTFGRPFARIDELVPGDRVVLTTPLARHVYKVVSRPWVVEPTDWSPIEVYPRKGSFLTLTSCHPEGSASHRIVSRAKLVRSAPLESLTTGITR